MKRLNNSRKEQWDTNSRRQMSLLEGISVGNIYIEKMPSLGLLWKGNLTAEPLEPTQSPVQTKNETSEFPCKSSVYQLLSMNR